MTKIPRTLLVVGLLAVVAACGDDEGGTSPADARDVAADAWHDAELDSSSPDSLTELDGETPSDSSQPDTEVADLPLDTAAADVEPNDVPADTVEDLGSEADATDAEEGDVVEADVEPDLPQLPPVPDLQIGPYQSALTMLVDTVRSLAASYDPSSNYDQVAAQGYVLQAIGELLWYARDYDLPERQELMDLAVAEIDELRSVSDQVVGGGPAYGLTDAWDAFGDGSVNPAFTAYTWQSGMAALGVAKIARVLVDSNHPEAASVLAFGGDLVRYWIPFYTAVTDGGYYWYSDRSSDAIAVHNTSALVAMAGQVLTEAGGGGDLGQRSQACADLLWARMSGNPTTGYSWNYADDGYPGGSRRAEDVSHALVTLQLMRFARDRDWWTNSQMTGVASTLTNNIWTGNPARVHGYVDGSSAGDREWTYSRAVAIGYAAHGNSPGGDPLVFDMARSLLLSSYLARYDRPVAGGTTSAVQSLVLAYLITRRPAAFEAGSRWRMEAGPGDADVPNAPGGVRFYTVEWDEPASAAAGSLSLMARQANTVTANVLVDLEASYSGRVAVSLTYLAAQDGPVQQWDGQQYHTIAQLPATLDDEGSVRWFRTSFELDSTTLFDYQGVPGTNVLLQITSEPTVHLIEATPLQ